MEMMKISSYVFNQWTTIAFFRKKSKFLFIPDLGNTRADFVKYAATYIKRKSCAMFLSWCQPFFLCYEAYSWLPFTVGFVFHGICSYVLLISIFVLLFLVLEVVLLIDSIFYVIWAFWPEDFAYNLETFVSKDL